MKSKTVRLAVLMLLALLLGSCALQEENPDNFSYSVNADNSAVINGYIGKRQEIVIPAIIDGHKVVGVDAGAFDENEKITRVVLPVYLESIGDAAFYGCVNLAEVEFPASLRTIGSQSFYRCDALTEVTLPEGLESIGGNAFWFCDALTSVYLPDSLTEIGGAAFASCKNLTSVRLPSRLKEIPWKLFARCEKLESVKLPASLKIIWDEAFESCRSLKEITLPDGLERIGLGAFSYCTSLEKICIPASVTDLYAQTYARLTENEENPFMGCSRLTEITLSPGNKAFFQQDGALIRRSDMTLIDYLPPEGVTSASIPDGVRIIGPAAVREREGVETVVIPETVTTIRKYAFSGSSLTGLTIPASVRTMEKYAIWMCYGLKTVTIPASVTSLDAETIYNCRSLESIIVDKDSRAALVLVDDPRLVIRE